MGYTTIEEAKVDNEENFDGGYTYLTKFFSDTPEIKKTENIYF